MKARFIFNSRFPGWIGAGAITLFPFVFCGYDEASCIEFHIVHHEMVHVEQVRRLGWFRMYRSYVVDYAKLRWSGLGHHEAYENLPLEREAFGRQNDPALLEAYRLERARTSVRFLWW